MSAAAGLAEALRAWRRRASPQAAGVDVEGARHVPGLRREELAHLAGLSVDYLVRLEQGRATNPSPQVLDALARALRLTSEERQAMSGMVGARRPAAGSLPRQVAPDVRRMAHRLTGTPAAAFTPSWDLLWWNAAWAALIGDPSGWAGRERNVVWQHFTRGVRGVQLAAEELEDYERAVVADVRLAASKYPDDDELVALVQGGSPWTATS